MLTRAPGNQPTAPSRRVTSPDEVYARAAAARGKALEGTSLILIGGCSRTGKSRLASELIVRLGREGIAGRAVGLDAWLVSVEKRPPGSTVLERYEVARMVDQIRDLLHGEAIHPPVYEVETRRRVAEQGDQEIRLESGVAVVDGVVALAIEALRRLADLRIYVETPDEVRQARLRDFYIGLKGLSPATAEALIVEREREEVPFIKGTAARADVIYCPRPSGGGVDAGMSEPSPGPSEDMNEDPTQ